MQTRRVDYPAKASDSLPQMPKIAPTPFRMTDHQKAQLQAFRQAHGVTSTQAALSALFDHAIANPPSPRLIGVDMASGPDQTAIVDVERAEDGEVRVLSIRHPDPQAVLDQAQRRVGVKRRWAFTNAMVEGQ